jgi:endo-1,4-beta-xylanase
MKIFAPNGANRANGRKYIGLVLIITALAGCTPIADMFHGKETSPSYTPPKTTFVAVTDISGIPSKVPFGQGTVLSPVVSPSNASNKTITWVPELYPNGSGTPSLPFAIVVNNTLYPLRSSYNANITADIPGGLKYGDYTKSFTIGAYTLVTNIVGTCSYAKVGQSEYLEGTEEPSNAGNIVWSVKDAGGTGASISYSSYSYNLITNHAGTLKVLATVAGCGSQGKDYTQEFTIQVVNSLPSFIPVSTISGVPATAYAGTTLTLSDNISPYDASQRYTGITWTVKSAGGTGASIVGTAFSATSAGTAVITATVPQGTASSYPGPAIDYTKDFTITVKPAYVAVTNVSDVPTSATAGTDLTLTGTVTPSNATNRTLDWMISSIGTTGASIVNGNKLHTLKAGTVKVYAVVLNGNKGNTYGDHYYKEFTITVK